jgi:hypothetical protein
MNHISLGWNFLSSGPEGLEELALVYYDEAKRQINLACKSLVFQRFWPVRLFGFSDRGRADH